MSTLEYIRTWQVPNLFKLCRDHWCEDLDRVVSISSTESLSRAREPW